MANGRCPRHGGRGAGAAAEDHRKRLRLAHSIYGFYGAEGRAMRDAAEAARTQSRLLRLVEALHAPAPVVPDHGDT
jgi:hypothetical protein